MTPPRRPGIAIGLVDHHRHALGLDTLHDALDRARPEVVAVRPHGQTIHADDRLLLALADLTPHHPQHLVGDEVFAVGGSAGAEKAKRPVTRVC